MPMFAILQFNMMVTHDNDDDDANAKVWHLTADNVGNLRLIPAQRIPQSQLANPLKAGQWTPMYTIHCKVTIQ